jgi:hypothetical protein
MQVIKGSTHIDFSITDEHVNSTQRVGLTRSEAAELGRTLLAWAAPT